MPAMHQIAHPPFAIASLGTPTVPSPLQQLYAQADAPFVTEDEKILFDDSLESLRNDLQQGVAPATLEIAGPRQRIIFDPRETTAAMVTCGGLCPGLNDVIRSVVMTLYYSYGVRTILGVRYGFKGFIARYGSDPMILTPFEVSEINRQGGSILGSSRGPQSEKEIVDRLLEWKVNLLFVVGGDGTLRGAHAIANEVRARGLPIGVVAMPKTIDDDFEYMDKSFGFETAFAEAVRSVRSAHVEATGACNGVGLVKLMGRESGFIAAHAALAESCVNFVLIPEVPFQLHGDQGLFKCLERRLEKRGHAVIVVAEGAGQDLLNHHERETDASGNPRLGDIGRFLKRRIEDHFHSIPIELNLKYIDPSYEIRSVPATPQDSLFCLRLAQNAVHAAMAGKTDLVIGRWHQHFVHIPLSAATARRRQVDPRGDLWLSVLQSTGQPAVFGPHNGQESPDEEAAGDPAPQATA